MTPSDPEAAGDQPRKSSRVKRLGNLLIALSALGVLVLGILATLDVRHGPPVAAAFTRVGGVTSVETALEASRFWLTPPQTVVETPADASQQILLGAAQCAMAYDAPLLYTSPDPKRQQLVNARINDWREIETRKGPLLPEVITIQTQRAVNNCRASGSPAGVAGLSTLKVPNQPLQPPHVPPRDTLAPVVVFAAAIQPADPPDVAVGMALAAHMTRAYRKVSLVVVPHYLESDPELENELQSQRELVNGGVVLGQTPTVPEDTRVLLRQLLTSRDQLGLIAQLQGDLADFSAAIAALLALLGAGVLVREAPEIKEQTVWLGHKAGPVVAGASHQLVRAGSQIGRAVAQAVRAVAQAGLKVWKIVWKVGERVVNKPEPIPAIADLRIALRDRQEVTVCLRNGWTVTGTTGEQGSPTGQGKDPTMTVLLLRGVKLEKAAMQIGTADSVLVPIGEIELIATGFSTT